MRFGGYSSAFPPETATRLKRMSVAIQYRRNSAAWYFGLMLLFGARFGDSTVDGKQVDFNREIRQILADRCFACHGPDAAERQGGLRLDDADAALQAGDSGEVAIVPGDPSASELLRRIESDSEGEVMPPPETNKHLSAEEKELLRRWIEEPVVIRCVTLSIVFSLRLSRRLGW